MSKHGESGPEQPIKTLIQLIQLLNSDSSDQESSERKPCGATEQLGGESKLCVFTSKVVCISHKV